MFGKITILYISQLLKAVLPLLFVPLIISVLGVEQYGLVSFLTMLTGVLGIFDLGISGTFIKVVSTGKDFLVTFKKVVMLFIKAMLVFLGFSIAISVFFYLFSDGIYSEWLKTSVKYIDALQSIKLIGVILACTYFKSYISSFIQGMEKQVQLAAWGMIYSVMFYCGAYVAIRNINHSIVFYFKVLSFVAIVDVLVLSVMLIYFVSSHKNKLISIPTENKNNDDAEFSFIRILKLSLHLSGLSVIWVIATQVDKIALSTYSRLEDYAHYQIAAQLATTVTLLSMPISQYLLPRLSSLYKRKEYDVFIKELTTSMMVFIIIVVPLSAYFFVFGDGLISLWMKNPLIGNGINEYASWLVSAAIFTAIMNFLFMALYAMNRLKVHLYIYAIYSLITIPLSVYIAKSYGATGSAKFLFIHSLFFMLLWGTAGFRLVLIRFLFPVVSLIIFTAVVSFISFKYMAGLFTGTLSLFALFFSPIANFILLVIPLVAIRHKISDRISIIAIRQ